MTDKLVQPLLHAPGTPADPFPPISSSSSASGWRRRIERAALLLAQVGLAVGLVVWLSVSPDAAWVRDVLRISKRVLVIVVPSAVKWIVAFLCVLWTSWAIVRFIDSITDDLAAKIGKAVAKELRRHR